MIMIAASWLSGCSIGRMLPSGSVLSASERARQFPLDTPRATVTYTSGGSGPPVVPFLVFGVTYDVDIVLQTTHPDWDMHEYARIATPDGPRWLAKDSRASDGDQLLVAEIENIDSWLPEIPLARKSGPVEVVDRSTEKQLDIELRYTNHRDEAVEVTYAGPWPRSLQRKRNGSTMGHSRGQVLAVLDLSHRDFAKRASVKIGGEPLKIEKIAGIVPMRLVLRQTQGGVAEAHYSWRVVDDGIVTTHEMPSGATVDASWEVMVGDEIAEVQQKAALRTLVYRYARQKDGALELTTAMVRPWNADAPNFEIHFNPSLPDLRRRFDGEWRGRWVMDVGDQRSHAVGTVSVAWKGEAATVEFQADEPWWAAERLVRSVVLPAERLVDTSVSPSN